MKQEFDNYYSKLISYIRDVMEESEVRVKEIAAVTGLKGSHISNKLSGKGSKFNILELVIICDYLGIEMYDLAYLKDKK